MQTSNLGEESSDYWAHPDCVSDTKSSRNRGSRLYPLRKGRSSNGEVWKPRLPRIGKTLVVDRNRRFETSRPFFFCDTHVAQSADAPCSGRGDCGFESHRGYQVFTSCLGGAIWQTRMVEVHVEQSLRVRVPPQIPDGEVAQSGRRGGLRSHLLRVRPSPSLP